jgi:sec-independent protein translocase protein TatB
VFNFSGSEIVFLLLLALIILGPEKLPDAIRSFGKTYAEFKKMTTGFQSELKSALDEPMREMRETADVFKQAASFDIAADMLEGKKPAAAPPTGTAPDTAPGTAPGTTSGTTTEAAGAAPPVAAPEPKQMWSAHDAAPTSPPVPAATAAPAATPAAAPTEAAVPDLSMLDSVVMDRDHTYRPSNPAEPASADDGEADAS